MREIPTTSTLSMSTILVLYRVLCQRCTSSAAMVHFCLRPLWFIRPFSASLPFRHIGSGSRFGISARNICSEYGGEPFLALNTLLETWHGRLPTRGPFAPPPLLPLTGGRLGIRSGRFALKDNPGNLGRRQDFSSRDDPSDPGQN